MSTFQFRGSYADFVRFVTTTFTADGIAGLTLCADVSIDTCPARTDVPANLPKDQYAVYDAARAAAKAETWKGFSPKIAAIKAVRQAFGTGTDKGTLRYAKEWVEKYFPEFAPVNTQPEPAYLPPNPGEDY